MTCRPSSTTWSATPGQHRVNWVGHSLGGMMVFPFLERSIHPERIANFVGMGSTIIQAKTPRNDMLAANAGIRSLLHVASAGRLGRPLTFFKMPGMEKIDKFYYSVDNVDWRTISRFYGYTLEDPGPAALRQFAPYLKYGHMLSADGTVDYSARLGEVTVPTLMIAGAADLISDVPSTRMTFDALASPDKTLYVFGRANGHVADYGHCDLAWSRHAPRRSSRSCIDWLDRHQPGVRPTPQRPTRPIPPSAEPARRRRCKSVTRSRTRPRTDELGDGDELGLGQSLLARTHRRLLELERVNHAEVNRAHRGGVVVDQANQPHPAGACHLDLLVELAPHGHLVGLEAAPALGVGLGDVPADAQRPPAMQPGLALRLSPRVAEDRVATAEDDIGDDLLQAGIILDLGAGPVFHQLGNQEGGEIALGIAMKALEPAQPVQLGPGNNQHTLA